MSFAAINKLTNLLNSLKKTANDIDNLNESNKAHRMIENNSIFSINLFRTQSDKFFPYLIEVEKNINELDYLLKKKKNDFSHALLLTIEQQLNALYNAISSNTVIHNAAEIQQTQLKKIKYRNMAKKLMLSSHELYNKLSEYQEFERRLLDMLHEKNSLATGNNKAKYTEEALVIHQRLGRCRQAISKVEREIELSEKSQLS